MLVLRAILLLLLLVLDKDVAVLGRQNAALEILEISESTTTTNVKFDFVSTIALLDRTTRSDLSSWCFRGERFLRVLGVRIQNKDRR